ncbi:MAG: hypothetical protein AB1696_05620 [Planctomycetota bacterium]
MRRCLPPVLLLILFPALGSSLDRHSGNLVPNPGFEQGVARWKGISDGGEAEIIKDAARAHARKACLLLHADNRNVGIDSDPIYADTDFDRNAPHLLSAYVSNLGVSNGNFGLRLYFFDADGKYISMRSFRELSAASPKTSWQKIEARIGPDTDTPFPRNLDHIVIRFSFWSKEGNSSGKALVDDVFFGPIQEAPAMTARTINRTPRGAVAIWRDKVPAVGFASDPAYLASLLAEAGFGVNFLTTEDLIARNLLANDNFDLLILPYGGCYPAAGASTLRRFISTGGDMITLGGRCFTDPIFKTPSGWITASSRKSNAAPPKPVAQLSTDVVQALADEAGKGGEPAQISLAKDHTGQTALRVVLPDLQTYKYVPFQVTGLPGYTVIRFCARGDEETKHLCIEANETDKSRWKAVVNLSTEWKEYELSTGEFLSYATEGRGGKGDFLHADRINRLIFGFPVGLVGKGKHAFEVSQLEWRGSDILPQNMAQTAILIGTSPAIHKAFGSGIRAGGASGDVPLFFGPQAFQNVSELRSPPGQSVFPDDVRIHGKLSGWTTATLEDNLHFIQSRKPSPSREFLPTEKLARSIPLLLTPDGRPAASLFVNIGGRYRDTLWACFGVDNRDLFPPDDAAMGKAFVQIVDRMLNGAFFTAAVPRFQVVNGKATMQVFTAVTNRISAESQLELHSRLVTGSKETVVADASRLLPIGPGATEEALTLEADADRFDWKDFRVQCDISRDGAILDRIETSLDVRSTLLGLCDRLVARQKERGDGKFHGFAFVDNRGTRGLLASYDLTGKRKYLDAAIRWGNAIIAEQREDGGYLMGYGYHPDGNDCYVADGGEIACGIARLIQYVSENDRPRFLNSLGKYMAYRESFRCEGGGIGVGWCWHDYGARPIKKLDKLTRIYSPENNIYTIGCTLACAIMYAQITKDPKANEAAVKDCYWWMERCKSTSGGAFVESAVWANKFLTGGTIKKDTEDFLRTKFIPYVIKPDNPWWRTGEGRIVQGIDGLAYYYDCIEKDPAVLAALMRATFNVCSPEALAGIPRILPKHKLSWGEWCYLNFAAVSLPDVIQSEIIRKPF